MTNARIAGISYLLYIAVAYPGIVLSRNVTKGDNVAAQLATLSLRASDVRLIVISSFLSAMCAFALAVSLYRITRDANEEIAAAGMICRATEGIVGALTIVPTLGLLDIARGGSSAQEASHQLANFLLAGGDWTTTLAAAFFAVGSTLFCWLLLRARIIPLPLGILGFAGSLIIAVGLPLQLAGYLTAAMMRPMWVPIALFEITVAFWFIIKGAREPRLAKQ
jgi:hypothetical protein